MSGARFAQAGHDVTLILRGANLAAVQQNGLKLIEEDGTELLVKPIKATSVMAEAGIQDVVILTLKAHQVAAIAATPGADACRDPDHHDAERHSLVVLPQVTGELGTLSGTHVKAVDPDGIIAKYIDVDRVIGSVVYPASEVISPGVIKVIEGNRFSLGEIDGSDTPSIRAISEAFKGAGFKSPISNDIRSEIWLKLWGNLSFNPISALTHATLEDICVFPATRELAANMMRRSAGHRRETGCPVQGEPGKTHQWRAGGGPAQDLHAAGCGARPAARTRCPGRLGHGAGPDHRTPTPNIDAVYALVSLLANKLQQHKGTLRIS